jgi:8-oxo-dGTP pyrophosphatase MutT (NUDIX family)
MGNPGDELVAIVDSVNRVTGLAPRREMRAQSLAHRSTYILVFNSEGELYVQKRTMTKDVYPGFLDPAAGGVVLAGESYEEGAKRELAEEMGIRGIPPRREFEFWFDEGGVKVWGGAFSCVYDGELTLQPEEVESVTLMRPEIVAEGKDRFTPDGLYVVRRYLGGSTAQMPSFENR